MPAGLVRASHLPWHETAVIIPALDEAAGVACLLPTLRRLGLGQIIVADNGSADGTALAAVREGAEVVFEPRQGYGAACQRGMSALADEIKIVAFLDADLSDDASYLPRLIEPIAAGRADLVIGCRDPRLRRPGAMNVAQRVGNWLATGLIRAIWGVRYRDLGPFRAIRRSALDRIAMRDRAYGWTVEMQVRAVQEGLRVEQVAVPYRRRVGRSKISGTVRGVVLAGYWILRTVLALALRDRRYGGRVGAHATCAAAKRAPKTAFSSSPARPPVERPEEVTTRAASGR